MKMAGSATLLCNATIIPNRYASSLWNKLPYRASRFMFRHDAIRSRWRVRALQTYTFCMISLLILIRFQPKKWIECWSPTYKKESLLKNLICIIVANSIGYRLKKLSRSTSHVEGLPVIVRWWWLEAIVESKHQVTTVNGELLHMWSWRKHKWFIPIPCS